MANHSSRFDETSVRLFPTYSRVVLINCHGSTSSNAKPWPVLQFCFLSVACDWENSLVSLEKSGRNGTKLWFVVSFSSARLFSTFYLCHFDAEFEIFAWISLKLNNFSDWIFHEFRSFWQVHVLLADTVAAIKMNKHLKTKTAFAVFRWMFRSNGEMTVQRFESLIY